MNRVAENIISMINNGSSIFTISEFFGGLENLIKLIKKYPYLNALIQTKLSGTLHCSAEDKNEAMSAFNLDFVIVEFEEVDMDDINHYNASIDVIIPEVISFEQMKDLYSWLYDYLSDMGSEVGSFNDSNMNKKMIWLYVEKINGKSFDINDYQSVSDKKVLEIIPSKYLV